MTDRLRTIITGKEGGVIMNKEQTASSNSWPCPKNNKMVGWKICWLINSLFPTKRYGNFDCWQCPNLLNLRRAAYKHKPDIYIGLITAIVVLVSLGGVVAAIWLLRSFTP